MLIPLLGCLDIIEPPGGHAVRTLLPQLLFSLLSGVVLIARLLGCVLYVKNEIVGVVMRTSVVERKMCSYSLFSLSN